MGFVQLSMKFMARRGLALVALLFCSRLAPGADSVGSAKTNAAAVDELFSKPKVLLLKIEIPSASLEALKKAPKTYVKGTVREGDKVYADAGIRLKGNAAFQAQEKKPSLTIKFNEFTADQLFHGHGRLILDNAHQDPTYLSEAIGSEIFRGAGVPAARTTFARVELNGRDAGLYVVEQAINRDFLSGYFKKTKGNLYEGAHNDVTDKLEKDSGDSSTEQPDVKKLASATREADPAQRWKKLGAVLDMDRFISFAAAEVLTWHHSGYVMAQNNYRIYHDLISERLLFIPHGLDLLFNKPSGPLFPEWKGLVAKAVLDHPEGQRRYRERLAALLNGSCKAEALQARLNELAGTIRPVLASDSAGAGKFDAALKALQERIAQRAHFVEEELKKTGK